MGINVNQQKYNTARQGGQLLKPHSKIVSSTILAVNHFKLLNKGVDKKNITSGMQQINIEAFSIIFPDFFHLNAQFLHSIDYSSQHHLANKHSH